MQDPLVPLVPLLGMASGVLVDVEALINCSYGYDIRGEIIGETGTVELAETGSVIVKREGRCGGRIPRDWRERFVRAYDVELQEWIDAATAGTATGPSSWDGYAATVVTDAGVTALDRGGRVEVSLRHRPDLYQAIPSGGQLGRATPLVVQPGVTYPGGATRRDLPVKIPCCKRAFRAPERPFPGEVCSARAAGPGRPFYLT